MASRPFDGPALTRNGVVVDLEDGHPIFFSHEKELSQGHATKVKARNEALRMRQQEAKLRALQLDRGEVCSLDAAGTLRGRCSPEQLFDVAWRGSMAARLKLFHRKRQQRSRYSEDQSGSIIFCISSDGTIRWHSRFEAHLQLDVDCLGVVHSMRSLPPNCRGPWWQGSPAERLRLFHRKKQVRQQALDRDPESGDMPVACAHPDGFLSWMLPTPPATPVRAPATAATILVPPCCRLDADGHVYDIAGLKPPLSPGDDGSRDRLKLFHRKRQQRMQELLSSMELSYCDSEGESFISGTTTPTFTRACSVDSEGIVHGAKPPGAFLEQTCSIDSEGVVRRLKEEWPLGSADRLKRFYRKKRSRSGSGDCDREQAVASLDDVGRIHAWQLQLADEPLIVPLNLEVCF
eukprot:TRINITY_DN74521_c0_g1_i1.p1 TRINITY_DN74521_c0_g1~~TRINITY_DN74521_c0_g1_i1.p1  ORF type:complete len:430 (+),score=86.44 TRINITY_DN74521_c0_g1_i1:78-1292(+)